MILDKKVEIEYMTWPEIKLAIEESERIALIPVGTVEEHGPRIRSMRRREPICLTLGSDQGSSSGGRLGSGWKQALEKGNLLV